MRSALIGSSGFVGSTILGQYPFDDLYRSSNIEEIRGRSYDLIVCAGAPAAKWKANREPAEDIANLRRLMDCVRETRAEIFVVISTVDVYPVPRNVDESTAIDPEAGDPYGRHRYELERFSSACFRDCRIVRLPGLFGAGLRKNFIFDLMQNPDALHLTDARSEFQFYDMSRLWSDLQVVIEGNLPLVNFATEPVSAAEVAADCFGRRFTNETEKGPVFYDMHTRFAERFGGAAPYMYSRAETLARVSAFAGIAT
jgi:hypothetical protein